MQRKQVVFIADSLDNAHRFQAVLSQLDVEVTPGSSARFKKIMSAGLSPNLVIFEASHNVAESVAQAETLVAENGNAAMLVIVKAEMLAEFRLPAQMKADFVVSGASDAEITTRIQQLLWPSSEAGPGDVITVEGMTLNLATYQVQVGGEPVDFTYLEYALLAFLITHPGRTYSRDSLLRRVWGFDYLGGSRTVDVHVRRVRAKLGPELATHLETVRGVGYLWQQ